MRKQSCQINPKPTIRIIDARASLPKRQKCFLASDQFTKSPAEKRSRFGSPRNRNIAIVAMVVIFAIVAVLAIVLWARDDSPKATEVKVNTETAGR